MKLRHCPFCSCEDIVLASHEPLQYIMGHEGDNIWTIDCMRCGASVPSMFNKENIIEVWNRRDCDV